tara:strand:- start:514 stop:714 length:201 start_codon:yes stop_codon:yes gene_type:complete
MQGKPGWNMAPEPFTEIAHIAGEAISETVGEKLKKIPFWRKVRTYLLFVPLLVSIIWFISINQGWF